MTGLTGGAERVAGVRSGDDWHLRDERELLERSLVDAEREHGAGDLTDEDYALLRARDERRLAEVVAALEGRLAEASEPAEADGGDEPAEADGGDEPAVADGAGGSGDDARGRRVRQRARWRRRWRRRWWLAAGGAAAVLAAAVLLLVDLVAPRLPGQYATGSISLNTAQRIERQLGQAKALVADGKSTEALALYGDVLAEDPRQPVALAEWGWLDWRAASSAKEQTFAVEGASALEEAVKVDPSLFAAQYYLGVVLYEEGAAAKAVTHFARFLADKPTATWLRDAAPKLRAAYRAAREPLPPSVPAG